MQVIIAQTSGFCGGVKRAMRIALDAAAQHGGLQSDGPLVHNRQALELLALHGIGADENDKPLLIRAHGIAPERRRRWRDEGRALVDATCAHVARNQRLAAFAAARGDRVILAGDPHHAEILAVAASAGPNCLVVNSLADIEAVPPGGAVFFLAQTTFSVELFTEMSVALRRRFPDCIVQDTICRATHDRQEETRRLAAMVDAVVVVGGRDSANTRRLADTARAVGKPVFSVETAFELHEGDFAAFTRVGVTSGASTPGWITQDVVNRLRFMGRPTPGTRFLRFLHPLMEGRVLTACSAAGLSLAVQFFLGGTPDWALAAAGGGYVFFAHTLNRRVPAHPEARRLSLIDAFYQKWRTGLLGAAWMAAGLSLLLAAWRGGVGVACLYALALAATSAYAWGSRRPAKAGSAPRVFTYPRSWTMAAGWALVLTAPPWMASGWGWAGAGALCFVFLVCLGGTLLRDLHDVASDSLMGIGTLPARLGTLRAEKLARCVLVMAVFLSLAAAAAALLRGGETARWLGFVATMPIVPALGLYRLGWMERGNGHDAVFLQAWVDGMGCLAGLLAVLWGGRI